MTAVVETTGSKSERCLFFQRKHSHRLLQSQIFFFWSWATTSCSIDLMKRAVNMFWCLLFCFITHCSGCSLTRLAPRTRRWLLRGDSSRGEETAVVSALSDSRLVRLFGTWSPLSSSGEPEPSGVRLADHKSSIVLHINQTEEGQVAFPQPTPHTHTLPTFMNGLLF